MIELEPFSDWELLVTILLFDWFLKKEDMDFVNDLLFLFIWSLEE